MVRGGRHPSPGPPLAQVEIHDVHRRPPLPPSLTFPHLTFIFLGLMALLVSIFSTLQLQETGFWPDGTTCVVVLVYTLAVNHFSSMDRHKLRQPRFDAWRRFRSQSTKQRECVSVRRGLGSQRSLFLSYSTRTSTYDVHKIVINLTLFSLVMSKIS